MTKRSFDTTDCASVCATASAFPSVDEICSADADARTERSVYERMQAPFSYLNGDERFDHRKIVHLAERSMRGWIFDEPACEAAKSHLGTRRKSPEASDSQTPASRVPITTFLVDYLRLFAQSCVMQSSIAAFLARPAASGGLTFVHSVDDALSRPDRHALFAEAASLFLQIHQHEQIRFAYGSSLKDVIVRELGRYPAESHQLLLTSTRGDFWTRYARDLLGWVTSSSAQDLERIARTYFNSDESHLGTEVERIRRLGPDRASELLASFQQMAEALATTSVRKRYATLGDLPGYRVGCPIDANTTIWAIDRLLWIDNVLEKVVDHKLILFHDIYLRLHVWRLAIACSLDAPAPAPRALVRAMDAAAVSSPHDKKHRDDRDEMLDFLIDRCGIEARGFAVPDSVFAAALEKFDVKTASALGRSEPDAFGSWEWPTLPAIASLHAAA